MSKLKNSTLIYGATSKIYPHDFRKVKHSVQKVIDFVKELALDGYNLTNTNELFYVRDFKFIKEVLNSTKKEGRVLRKSFGKSTELEEYTDEDWIAIFAGYSITYNWKDKFIEIFEKSPEAVLGEYNKDLEGKYKPITEGVKDIQIMTKDEYFKLIKNILESKTPLRLQQEEIIQTTDVEILEKIANEANIVIGSINALVMNTLYRNGKFPIVKSLADMQKFILNNLVENPNNEDFNNQILKPALKRVKFRIPTRMRKFILSWFNKQNARTVAENMFPQEDFWKRMFKHCKWCNASEFTKRYPSTTEIIELLYSKDRSWTFNSRYQKALKELDYEQALKLLMLERPGLVLRNIVNFCRYTTGTQLASKLHSEDSNTRTFIKKGAEDLIKKEFKDFVFHYEPNVKQCFQTIEELSKPENNEDISEKVVRGITVRFCVPIPPVKSVLKDIVIDTLKEYIKRTKQPVNETLGKVYLSDSLKGISLQYSGADDNSITLSGGGYLTPGSEVKLNDLLKGNKRYVRFGVLWRGKSCDIDLSTRFYSKNDTYNVYYGNPEMKHNAKIVAVSSGDITSCDEEEFSTEFIDVDLDELKKTKFKKFISFVNIYSGANSFKNIEAYFFFSAINDRILPRQKIEIDLAKQDYAIKISDDSRQSLGIMYNIKENSVKVLNGTYMSIDLYTNINHNASKIDKFLQSVPKRISFEEALSNTICADQITFNKNDANLTIGITDDCDINVLKDFEGIQKIIF